MNVPCDILTSDTNTYIHKNTDKPCGPPVSSRHDAASRGIEVSRAATLAQTAEQPRLETPAVPSVTRGLTQMQISSILTSPPTHVHTHTHTHTHTCPG